ncbi:SCO family protein [Flaviflagellibacter deserti]|uniref:SCO family protein n=1 Tax=Flaviflagellibacter deserti TaxID=2267266 RepID=A0ABV9YX42_9HYPH
MKVRPSLVLGPVLFLVGLIALGAAFVAFRPQVPTAQSVGASLVGGPFKLIDQSGQEFTDRSVAGKPFLVFFGFTHCPDVCPTKLFEISQVLNAMGDRANDLQVLFVTVDPERDTPDVMGRYVSSFNSKIRGLTGDRPSIDAMIKAYRAYSKKVPTEDGSYTMDHTSIVYMMDRNGQFVAPLNLDRAPDEVAKDLERIV